MTAKSRGTRTGEDGYILLSVLVIIFVLAIVGAAYLMLAGGETKASQQNLDSQRAFWLAESGKHRAIRRLSDPIAFPTPPATDQVIYQDVAGPDGGTYTVNCIVDPGGAWSAQKQFMLDCVGRYHGVERRVRQKVEMQSFARYAYFTDDEFNPAIGNIWFTTTDMVQGPTHSNGTFRILGDPHFQGLVTSASDHMTGYPNFTVNGPGGWPVGGNDPTFDQSFLLGVQQIPLPSSTLDLRQLGQNGGVYINAEAQLEIGKRGTSPTGSGTVAPGWLRYRPASPANSNWIEASISALGNKVFYCNSTLHVQPYATSTGTLTGEMTIASNRSVRIENDIRYTNSDVYGAPAPNCRDLLGIVAGDDVIFANNAANQSNLIVDATLMALDTSIMAESYSQGSPRGALTIWGGLIQDSRGPVGTTSNGTIVSGYRKDYHYDTRVTARTPPGFPQTGNYIEVEWEETWDATDPF